MIFDAAVHAGPHESDSHYPRHERALSQWQPTPDDRAAGRLA